jgi:hypothetical protein
MTDFDPIPCWHRMVLEYGYPLSRYICEDCNSTVDSGASHCPNHQLVPVGKVQDQ